MTPPQFVLVKTTSPRGTFGRAGLRFTRDWRPLRIEEKPDLASSVIDAVILKRLEAETDMLAVRPATADEVAELNTRLSTASLDPAAELDELKHRNADLEARLMRLEVGPDRGELTELRTKNSELAAKNADLEARLLRLESRLSAPEAAHAGPAVSERKPGRG